MKARIGRLFIRVGVTDFDSPLRAPGIERQPCRHYAGFVMGGLRWQDLASILEGETVR